MNRFAVFPFNTVTSRNSPSNSHCLFGVSKWLRHLILCPPGHVLIYLDWSSQEYVIAAALSQCEAMLGGAVHACERYYPALQFVVWAGKSTQEAMAAAMFDTQGEA